jgi:hypothetical protein
MQIFYVEELAGDVMALLFLYVNVDVDMQILACAAVECASW